MHVTATQASTGKTITGLLLQVISHDRGDTNTRKRLPHAAIMDNTGNLQLINLWDVYEAGTLHAKWSVEFTELEPQQVCPDASRLTCMPEPGDLRNGIIRTAPTDEDEMLAKVRGRPSSYQPAGEARVHNPNLAGAAAAAERTEAMAGMGLWQGFLHWILRLAP